MQPVNARGLEHQLGERQREQGFDLGAGPVVANECRPGERRLRMMKRHDSHHNPASGGNKWRKASPINHAAKPPET